MNVEFHEEMTLAAAARANPKARQVIEKHFGKACFSCPGFSAEPLFMGARMHAVDIDQLLKDLNEDS